MSTTRPASHQLGDGFALAGVAFLTLGGYLAAVAFDVVPTATRATVGDTWPLAVVLGGAVWAARGARPAGGALAALGVVLLVVIHLPGAAVLPAVLVAIGAAVLLTGGTGRRLSPTGAEVAAFSDVERTLEPGTPHGLVALFGDVRAGFRPGQALGGAPVRAFALFGSVRLEVPHDVAVDLRQTAVFGDVRAPSALAAPAADRVTVRALAVFGDVRLERA